MASLIFTSSGLEEFVRNANAGPNVAEKARKIPGYWESVNKMSENFSASLGLVVEPERTAGANEGEYILLTFVNGKCTNAQVVDRSDAASADYVLQGPAGVWQAVFRKEKKATRSIMRRDIRLARGDLHGFFRRFFFVAEWLEAGSDYTAIFPSTQP